MQAARGASLTAGDHDEAAPRRPLVILAATAMVALVLDLTTKVVAVRSLEPGESVPLIGDILQLTLVRNPGAAFSTGTSYTLLLSLVAIGAVVVVLVLARRVRDRFWAFGLGALLGGVLGNLTDRVFREPGVLRGHVVDFLELPNWPVFNLADVFINVAAGVIVVQALRGVALDGGRSGDEPVEDA